MRGIAPAGNQAASGPPNSCLDSVTSLLQRYPSLWPAAFFLLFLIAIPAVSRSRSLSALLGRVEPSLLWLCGFAGLGTFVVSDLVCLGSPAFFDFFESSGASLAYSVFHGGVAYPDTSSAERYCLPYGPILYLVLGSSQWALGPSVFSSKLPCCLAALLAVGLFWRILRRRGLPVIAACALAGWTAACILGFRVTVVWTKSDPLIFLVVMVGIWAAYRRNSLGPVVLGACIGLAMGLKITALAYFLPILLIAFFTGWNWRAFFTCGAVFLAVSLLPFVLLPGQFPWQNYLAFFRTVGREGLNFGPTMNFLRWVAMLTGLIFISDHFIRQSTTVRSRRRGWAYRTALASGIALVAIPACAVGASPHHLMPFVPLAVLSFGNLFDRSESPEWQCSGNPLWRAAVYGVFSGCLLVAVQTASQFISARSEFDGPARACEADLRQILKQHPQSTILMGTSRGDELKVPARFRCQLVFAGHPIGLDAAVVSDYQFGGIPDPDLPRLLEEIRRRDCRPFLWLLPRGGAPFTSANSYDGHLQIYPEKFRKDFSDRFEHRETTAFFDVYFPIKEQ
jgi:hypothetical protein